MSKKERYFDLTYLAEIKDGQSWGSSSFTSNGYPSWGELKEHILKMNPNFLNVIPINMQEMTKTDYEEWNKHPTK